MNSFCLFLALCVAVAQGFSLSATKFSVARLNNGMALAGTPAGVNMKPQFDGTFKEAGAHLEVYTLEHENGSKALVDTKTATCISWKTKDGKEMITKKDSVHELNGATLKGHFVPEERAKKVSFDRMIFKCTPDDNKDLEYRADVTMREDCLEYDITMKNLGTATQDIVNSMKFNVDPSVKVTKKTGFKESTDTSVSTGKWTIPVGKFKETEFFVKISA